MPSEIILHKKKSHIHSHSQTFEPCDELSRKIFKTYLDGLVAGESLLVLLVPQDDERSPVLIEGDTSR